MPQNFYFVSLKNLRSHYENNSNFNLYFQSNNLSVKKTDSFERLVETTSKMLTKLSALKIGYLLTYLCKEEYIGNKNKVKQFLSLFYYLFKPTKKARFS